MAGWLVDDVLPHFFFVHFFLKSMMNMAPNNTHSAVLLSFVCFIVFILPIRPTTYYGWNGLMYVRGICDFVLQVKAHTNDTHFAKYCNFKCH